MVITPPHMHDSAVSPCFHGCLAFLCRHYLPQSPSLCPLGQSSFSQQQTSPLDFSTVSMLQLPIDVPCMGPVSLSRACMTVARIICVILILFRLPQISCFIFSLKCFCSNQNSCPDVGIGPLLQFPNPPRAGPVLLTILFFLLIPSS